MTEVEIKELAREYINSCTKKAGFVILTENIMNDFIDLFVAGFMKCIELNKGIKWHDLRKDPNDLPDNSRTVLDEARGRFYYFKGHFYSISGSRLNHIPIAWCEIPVFEEAGK